MKQNGNLVGGVVFFGVLMLIGIEMNIHAAPTTPVATASGSAPVTVVNTTPVPVTGTITGQITGQVSINNQPTVNAVQSGPWTVGLGAGSEKLDAVNAHLSNLQNSVGQFTFDPSGNLHTILQGPVATTAAAVTKSFGVSLRLDPFGDSGDIPVTVGGNAATIKMSMLVLLSGHDNATVFVQGPFLAGSSILRLPVLINSQTTVVTFPTAIPTSSILVQCDNTVEHCDASVSIVGM